MNPAALFIPQVYVLAVRFETTGQWHVIRLLTKRNRSGVHIVCEDPVDRDAPGGPGIPAGYPTLMLVYGQGVITKRTDQAAEIIARVTAQSERFDWTYQTDAQGHELFSFVQRTQMAPVEQWSEGVSLADTRHIAAPQEKMLQETVLARVREFYAVELAWRRLMRPSPGGALLGSMIALRARLPMLGIVLVLLIANYLYSGKIDTRRQALQQQLSLLENQHGKQEQLSLQKQRIFADFNRNIPHPYSLLCDRIAAAVPREMLLSELSIRPLLKTLENGSPVETEMNAVLICGSALKAEAVAGFCDRLKKEKFTRDLTLNRLEQQSESGLFRFTIRLAL